MDVKEQDILGNAIGAHWYYRAKAAAMLRLLEARTVHRVLDVGAGSGFFSRVLLEHGAREAVCVDPAYPAEHEEAKFGRRIRFVRDVGIGDFDTVLLMDVLEHVDDDVGLLRAYAARVPPGARFLISVPAFQFMWSGHDVFLEHRRRYTLPQLERLVDAAGLPLVHGCYFYALTFPLAAARRFLARLGGGSMAAKSDLRRHSAVVNRVLWSLCAAELPFFGHNRIAGLTVFCLAEKPRGAAGMIAAGGKGVQR